MGFDLIPRVILLSPPTLAAVALLAFVLASILGVLVRADLAFQVLAACAVLQAGLLVGLHLVLRAFRAVGGAIQGLFTTAPDAVASAQAQEWFARHDAVSAPVGWRLVWLLGGYLVALAATELVSPRRSRARGTSETAGEEPERIPVQPVVAAPRLASLSASPAAIVFDQSTYAVTPRQTLLELFLRHYSVYDIQSVPPSSRARFSFSWRTQVLRRAPDGPDMYALKPAERHGPFRSRSYLVIDLATGSPIGTLKPAGADWEVLDAGGATIARVVEERAGAGFARYVASAGDQVLCRFTWAMQGLSVANAALDVEFLPGCDAFVDRALAIALGPLLEHQGRRKSEWANR